MSIPERIGRYRVAERIGRGGMGSVYRGHDPVLDRMVAIKVMAEEADSGTEARERFLREAQSAARLNHPNVITVYELGEDRGQVFIVMELLEGEPLSRLIARIPPPPLRRKLHLMVQICEGLAFAHQHGVIHRDIKPANIFVLKNGQVKILDFGIARVGTSELTRTGFLMGTPTYMSPEQTRGRRTDARSDIFSVGVVFYELLSGRKPFVGEDYFETLEKVRSEDPLPLAEVAPGAPPPLIRAVHRALVKDPAARYQTLEDLKADLMTVPDLLAPESGPEDLREAVDRKFAEVVRLHRMLVAAVGSAALVDETMPFGEPGASGAGLATVLRDLESRTDRLRAIARTVERLEPGVFRGIAAFERSAYPEAIAELDAVLREIPEHQRARDYRDRARLEEIRERTVKATRSATEPAVRETLAGTAEARGAYEPEGATALATPPASGIADVEAQPAGRTEVTRSVSGTRPVLALAGVGVAAVVAGGLYLFALAPAPRLAPVVPTPAPARTPAPAPTPPPMMPVAPSPEAPAPVTPLPVATPPPPATPAPVLKPKPAPGPVKPAPARTKLTAEEAALVMDALTFAQLFQERGQPERALEEYRKVLALDPTHPEARKGVSELEAQLKSKP